MIFSKLFREMGVRKIISKFTIVKPRVERVHFVEKSNSGSLEDMIAGKMFLQKNQGVKQRKQEEIMKRQRETLKQTKDTFEMDNAMGATAGSKSGTQKTRGFGMKFHIFTIVVQLQPVLQ